MPVIAAVSAIVGTGISIYGDIKSASDQASLDQTKASIAEQQATEVQAREVQNEAIRDQQAYRQKLQFGASYAASGKAGTGVGGQLQIQNQTDLQNMVSNREAQFQESMLQQQAGVDTTLASQTTAAGDLNAIGAGVKGLGTAGAGFASTGGTGYGGTQSMGNYPSLGVNTNFGSVNSAGVLGGGS